MSDQEIHLKGAMYCRGCGYELRGQVGGRLRCPECGRGFDPTVAGSFRKQPLRGAWWKWAWRAVVLFLVIGAAAGSTWGWLYWGWTREQTALKKLDAVAVSFEPLGGKRLRTALGPAGWVLDRVVGVKMSVVMTDTRMVYLREFKELDGLDLYGTSLTDAGLVELKELKRLQVLMLGNTRITDAGLAHLKAVKISWLSLSYTGITDTGLPYLKDLKGIRYIDLHETRVTDAGFKALQLSMPTTTITRW